MATNDNKTKETNFIPFTIFRARFSKMMLSRPFTRKKDGKEFRKLGFWDNEGHCTLCTFSESMGCPTMSQIQKMRETLMIAEIPDEKDENLVHYKVCEGIWEDCDEGWED